MLGWLQARDGQFGQGDGLERLQARGPEGRYLDHLRNRDQQLVGGRHCLAGVVCGHLLAQASGGVLLQVLEVVRRCRAICQRLARCQRQHCPMVVEAVTGAGLGKPGRQGDGRRLPVDAGVFRERQGGVAELVVKALQFAHLRDRA
ncbi:hypothetical protein D3C81_1872880 [compost metagenome]